MRYLAAILLCSQAAAAEIPLDSVWGFDLPDTQDIAGITLPAVEDAPPGLDYAQYRRRREFAVEQFRQALILKPPTELAYPAFVFPHPPGFHTLHHVSSRVGGFPRGELPRVREYLKTVEAGDAMTLVVFSHPCAYYWRLLKIEREENRFTVHYQFQPHYTPEVTCHFALIPIGELEPGDYEVRLERTPKNEKYREFMEI